MPGRESRSGPVAIVGRETGLSARTCLLQPEPRQIWPQKREDRQALRRVEASSVHGSEAYLFVKQTANQLQGIEKPISTRKKAPDVNPTIGAKRRRTVCFFLPERDAGLLDFCIGQQPDQRLVMEIHHLNPVPPRITEIAPEFRFDL